MTIVEKCNRGSYGEGRTSGMAFALLKKISDEEFHTMNALSPCKDYLNEIVFTENTGIPSSAYGFYYNKKENIFEDCFYLAIELVGQMGGKYWYGKGKIEEDQKYLKENHKNIEKLMNSFEDELDMSSRTIITPANDTKYLVQGPIEWTRSTHAMSLYTLILRCSMLYDGSVLPMDYLKDYSYSQEDRDLLKNVLPKLELILKEKRLPDQCTYHEESARKKQWSPHNYGIWSWVGKFDLEAVKN